VTKYPSPVLIWDETVQFGFASWLRYETGFKYRAIRGKPKAIASRSHMFSYIFLRLHIFASSFEWFTGLVVSSVIGNSDYIGFGSYFFSGNIVEYM